MLRAMCVPPRACVGSGGTVLVPAQSERYCADRCSPRPQSCPKNGRSRRADGSARHRPPQRADQRRDRHREECALHADDEEAGVTRNVEFPPMLELSEKAAVEATRQHAPGAGEPDVGIRATLRRGARGDEQQRAGDQVVHVRSERVKVRPAPQHFEQRQHDPHPPRCSDFEAHAGHPCADACVCASARCGRRMRAAAMRNASAASAMPSNGANSRLPPSTRPR